MAHHNQAPWLVIIILSGHSIACQIAHSDSSNANHNSSPQMPTSPCLTLWWTSTIALHFHHFDGPPNSLRWSFISFKNTQPVLLSITVAEPRSRIGDGEGSRHVKIALRPTNEKESTYSHSTARVGNVKIPAQIFFWLSFSPPSSRGCLEVQGGP